MHKYRLLSAVTVLLLVANLLPLRPAASAPPQPDLIGQLQSEAGGSLRVSYHHQTGLVNYLGTNPASPWQVNAAIAAGTAPEAAAELAAREFLAGYGTLFGLQDPARELTVRRNKIVDNGRARFVRFQQVYQGVPVFGGELIVHVDQAQNVVAVIGEAAPRLALATQAAVPADKAAQAALNAVSSWHAIPASRLQATPPALWVFDPALVGPRTGPARLVWRVEVTPTELLPIRETVLIDAQTGNVALHFNEIATALDMATHNANNGTSLPGTLICDETDLNCAAAGADDHAKDAHKYAASTYNIFMALHGRDSIDDAGMTLISTVHYGSNYANAFWNGTQMVYGDAYPFARADDVVAHELTHGVTDYESELFYYYQSGAINEALSDIWGEFVDLLNGQGNDTSGVRWLMGEDITGLGAIRDMANPPDFGDPDKMSSPYYYSDSGDDPVPAHDHGGVHRNSGVANKAAFLMTDGGSFNGYTIASLGITTTAHIWYEAATNLLTSGADYLDLYNALYQGCQNLVAPDPEVDPGDCDQVRNATLAVEMNEEPYTGYNTEVDLCPDGSVPTATLFYDDLESGTGNWTTGSLGTGTNRWSQVDFFAHSGTHALLGNDFPATASDSAAAMNSSFALGSNAYLHFAHAYGFEEANNDGGVLEYSLNNGTSWTDAGSLFSVTGNGYNGVIDSGPLSGRSGFVGDSHGYISSRASLASLAGQSVRFRWRMSTDNFGADMGWWLDDVRIYTCGSAESVSRVNLPLLSNGSGGPTGTWTTITQEGFEGAFPGAWQTVDSDTAAAQHFFSAETCEKSTGSFSGWAVGGGANGSGLSCGANYPDNASSWLYYANADLTDATAAELNVQLWLNAEYDFDLACLMASTDGSQFFGDCYTGSTSDTFVPLTLDLSNVFTLGDLTGQSGIWLAVYFDSDESFNEPGGAFVDDIVVRKCVGGTCAAAASASALSVDGLRVTQRVFEKP